MMGHVGGVWAVHFLYLLLNVNRCCRAEFGVNSQNRLLDLGISMLLFAGRMTLLTLSGFVRNELVTLVRF